MVTSGSTVARLVMDTCSTSFSTLVVEDRDTMATRWTAPVGPIAGTQGDLVVADGRIYVLTGSGLTAFALGGCGASTCPPLWTKTTGLTGPKLWGRGPDGVLKGIPDQLQLYEVRRPGEQPVRTIDPVCLMELNPAAAAARLTWHGRELQFCSDDCLALFVAAPDRYPPSRS
jgi:YHS domain-containing protein